MRHWLLGAFVVVCALALTAPLLAPVQSAAPLLLFGVPFALIWVVGWVLASFVALWLYHLGEARR